MEKTITLTHLIRDQAAKLGFSGCGFAQSGPLLDEKIKLTDWFSAGRQADMHHLKRNLDKRIDPSMLLDGAKSVIVLLIHYYNGSEEIEKMPLRIARYTLGEDYHEVIRGKLQRLLSFIQSIDTEIAGKCFTDSGPVLEKAWARRAGVGWIGNNSLLLNKDHGSFVALGVIIINRELTYDIPVEDGCGNCHKCIDACPTGAIVNERVIDARKCIAYHTIETKGPFDASTPTWNDWIFGCDICQEACPWNKHQSLTRHHEFAARKDLLAMTLDDWANLDKQTFDRLFKDSAIARTGFEAFKRNIIHVMPSLRNK